MTTFPRFLVLIASFAAASCTAISGSYPIAVTRADRQLFEHASQVVEKAPFIAPTTKDSVLYMVAFDGTLNDKDRVSADERKTVIGEIAATLGIREYYPGPGMQSEAVDIYDAAFGTSTTDIAKRAASSFLSYANDIGKKTPGTEIRVFVTGFSRGGAAARHFMHVVDRAWAASPYQKRTPVRFYAVLYDTVPTGQTSKLHLEVPPSLDYLIHFVATNEPRDYYVPVLDFEFYPVSWGGEERWTAPQRINTIRLGGAHSDIGASYKKGIGDMYLALTHQLLYKMGLGRSNCWETDENPASAGKHDSRGLIDKVIFRTPRTDSPEWKGREAIDIYADRLETEAYSELLSRIFALSRAGANRGGFYRRMSAYPDFDFGITPERDNLFVNYTSPVIKPGSVVLQKADDDSSFKLIYIDWYSGTPSTLILKPHVVEALRRLESPTLSIYFLDREGESFIELFVNSSLVDSIKGDKTTSYIVAKSISECTRMPDGSLRSPIRNLIVDGRNG